MTAEEAIKRIRDHMDVHHIGEYPHIKISEALNMAISALREQEERRWIPVTDRLPEKATEYLYRCCICENDYSFYMVLTYYLFDEDPHFQHECEHGLRVTHWMPITRDLHQAEQDTEPQKEDNDAKMQ